MKKTSSITFRISDEIKDMLSQVAKSESRSISQQVEYFVKIGLSGYLSKYPTLKEKYEIFFTENILNS